MQRKTEMKNKLRRFKKNFLRDWQLYLIILLPAIYIGIFSYGPMYGIQIAFRDYNPGTGITGSPWVGWKWFEKFLNDYRFKDIFMNTIGLSLYNLIAGFPLPITLALILNALRNQKYKKFVQTVSYVPHFISVMVLVSMFNMVFSPVNGIYGTIYRMFSGVGYPVDFRGTEAAFQHIYVWTGVWQEVGWSSIIYLSALSSVSAEIHEAAQIDGASRFKRMIHVDIPAIMPTICIMLIMRCGSIVSVGYEKVFLLQTPLNLTLSEVISTYVYKEGLNSFKNFSYGTAVTLFNTTINLILLMIVNTITKKMTENNVSLF